VDRRELAVRVSARLLLWSAFLWPDTRLLSAFCESRRDSPTRHNRYKSSIRYHPNFQNFRFLRYNRYLRQSLAALPTLTTGVMPGQRTIAPAGAVRYK
jgi:hypothetical protein